MTVKLTYCFMCDMKICPKCVPALGFPPSGYVPICGVCRSNYGHERHMERMTALLEEGASEESFLDITIKSKGTSTPAKNERMDDNVRSEERTKVKHDKVCTHYLKGRCKHGRIGKDCL